MAYSVPIVNFAGPLSTLGAGLGRARKESQISEALSALGPNASWEDRANAVLSIDPSMAYKFGALGTRQAEAADDGGMTPYQAERLAIARANLENTNKDRRSTIEQIKAKIAAGEPLSPGEDKLYQDSLRTDPFAKLLAPQDEPAAPSAAPQSAPAVRKVQTETIPVSKGPLPFPSDKSQLESGQVYNLPNGSQGLWNGQEFEVLN